MTDRPAYGYYTREGGPDHPFTSEEYTEQARPREGESAQDAWDRVHRVAQDEVLGYRVSTVCLMIDHNFGDGPRPVIYETMVFGDGPWDEYQDRYQTEAEALVGHRLIVAAIGSRMKP